MNEEKWNPGNLSVREYIWNEAISQYMDTLKLDDNGNILACYIDSSFNVNKLIQKQIPKGTLKTIKLASNNLTYLKKPVNLENNQYHCIFGLFHLHLIKTHYISYFINNIYPALKPTGRLIIIFPTENTSASKTYKKVGENALCSGLKNNFTYNDEAILFAFKNALKNSQFLQYTFNTYQTTIELPSLDVFKQCLHQVSFLFRTPLPSDVNESVIDAQTKIFEEICNIEHKGRYLYEFELNTINIIK